MDAVNEDFNTQQTIEISKILCKPVSPWFVLLNTKYIWRTNKSATPFYGPVNHKCSLQMQRIEAHDYWMFMVILVYSQEENRENIYFEFCSAKHYN